MSDVFMMYVCDVLGRKREKNYYYEECSKKNWREEENVREPAGKFFDVYMLRHGKGLKLQVRCVVRSRVRVLEKRGG